MIRGAGGDDAAFELLVGRWEQRIFSFLERMLGSREEAQDVTQEAFLRMCLHAKDYRPGGQFRSWLFRIAGNQARSRLRRRKIISWVRFEPAAHDRPGRDDRPDRPLEAAENRLAVRSALGKLPVRQREAVVLRQYQEMSYREIAETMRTTVSAVETLLFRAMRSLRGELVRRESRE